MNAETLVLLHKLLDKLIKDNDVEVDAGEYHVDEKLIIDIKGLLRKQPDEVYQKTVAVAFKSVFALCLATSGAMRPYIQKLFKDCMIQSVTAGPDFKSLIESEIENIDKWIEEINDLVNSGGKGTRTGKTITSGNITISTESRAAV